MNVLDAIMILVDNPICELREFYESKNRVNSMGEALEEYVKDLFANTINETDPKTRKIKQAEVFSYLGNQNNPPDFMINGGDAIEVKKIESRGSALALNSSYPKAKMFSSSKMITNACRECEDWDVKDIIYAVGVVNGRKLTSLFFVYGIDYAASAEVYDVIKSTISSGVNSIPSVEFAETKELGRANRVDPLGLTYLRIRGMWHITNPMKAFKDIYSRPDNQELTFMAVINNEKYMSFDERQREKFEYAITQNDNLKMKEVLIQEPDNPARLKNAKLITFYV
ncbi:MAG: NgoPII family restriction endonuclease [Alkaliphilus sp.]